VVSAEHRKNARGSEHEYIILDMVDRGIHCYARIDRRPSNPSSLRIQIGAGVPAKDTLSISSFPFSTSDSYSVYTLNFPEATRPNALDLAALLNSVISLAPQYYLYTSGCYWFARMIFEGLEHIFSGEVLQGEVPQNRGKYAGLVRVVNDDGAFLLRKPRALRRWKKLQSSISSIVTHPRTSDIHGLLDYVYRSRREVIYLAVTPTDVQVSLVARFSQPPELNVHARL